MIRRNVDAKPLAYLQQSAQYLGQPRLDRMLMIRRNVDAKPLTYLQQSAQYPGQPRLDRMFEIGHKNVTPNK